VSSSSQNHKALSLLPLFLPEGSSLLPANPIWLIATSNRVKRFPSSRSDPVFTASFFGPFTAEKFPTSPVYNPTPGFSLKDGDCRGLPDRELPGHKHRNTGFLGPKSIKKSEKLLHARFPPLPGGGLEPDLRVLFSAIFHGVSLGNFHQGRKRRILAEEKLWRFVAVLNTNFLYVLVAAFPRGYQKSQLNTF
jgi:hypothetical protein